MAAFAVGFFTLLATLYAIKTQLDTVNAQLVQQAKLASAQYILNLSDTLNSPRYTSIMDAIEDHSNNYSLRKAGFSDDAIEDYMGHFETVGDLVQENVIDYQMAYNEFSYDAEKAYCNQDVQYEISSDRATDPTATGTAVFWQGFQSLTLRFLATDSSTCAMMNNQ